MAPIELLARLASASRLAVPGSPPPRGNPASARRSARRPRRPRSALPCPCRRSRDAVSPKPDPPSRAERSSTLATPRAALAKALSSTFHHRLLSVLSSIRHYDSRVRADAKGLARCSSPSHRAGWSVCPCSSPHAAARRQATWRGSAPSRTQRRAAHPRRSRQGRRARTRGGPFPAVCVRTACRTSPTPTARGPFPR